MTRDINQIYAVYHVNSLTNKINILNIAKPSSYVNIFCIFQSTGCYNNIYIVLAKSNGISVMSILLSVSMLHKQALD